MFKPTEGGTVCATTLGDLSLGRVVSLLPQDRSRWPGGLRLFVSVLSLLIIALVVREADGINLVGTTAFVPRSPLFWLLFAASYLALPVADWIIFRRLWGVGPGAFGALVRKLVYNELLLDYVGDAYFYGWSRKTVGLEAAPFGAVKDVAILSAMAANGITLGMVVIAWPAAATSALGLQTRALMLSLALVLMTSIAVLFFRRSLFSLQMAQLRMILAIHIARLVTGVALSAFLWHLALPIVPVATWLLLATIRLLIGRLPFIPNKDVLFAGVAFVILRHDVEIAPLLTLMAGLTLGIHLLVGGAFALTDPFRRKVNA